MHMLAYMGTSVCCMTFLCFLLQLPSPQLEGALKKFASLRGPLAAYANQPSVKTSLPRYKLLQTINNPLCQKILES